MALPTAPHDDLFCVHHSGDTVVVEALALRLRAAGGSPWLDRWALAPGGRWQEERDAALLAVAACVIIVGPSGLGDRVREEATRATRLKVAP